MKSCHFAFLLLEGAATLGILRAEPAEASEPAPKRPNVLFIAIDDLRDWVHYLGCEDVRTPHLDRLAARGVHFTRSYCAAPVCNPSRTALLSGLRPGTTGVYDNRTDWRHVIPDAVTLPLHFRRQGYYVAGAGKIYHGSFPRRSDWDDYRSRAGEEDEAFEAPVPRGDARGEAGGKGSGNSRGNGGGDNNGDDSGESRSAGRDATERPADTKTKAADYRATRVGAIVFGPTESDDAGMPDYANVSYIARKLGEPHDRPFFLACGLFKPHLPWRVPKKYFDMYPLEKVKLPPVKEGDLDDVPPAGVRMAQPGEHAAILRAAKWREAVQAYLATITFTDAMVGRLLDAYDASPQRDTTIICLWSDHGWNLGEKEHWRKFALWEETTRSPLLFLVPGLTKPGGVCGRPVDFMSIYSTLCDLCGLPTPPHVEGVSLRPLLADPGTPWDRPAVTTYLANNHAVRTERWRYIRYADGSEELYDHIADPHEWKNLAQSGDHAEVKKRLAAWLPEKNAPGAQRAPAQKATRPPASRVR